MGLISVKGNTSRLNAASNQKLNNAVKSTKMSRTLFSGPVEALFLIVNAPPADNSAFAYILAPSPAIIY